MDFSDFTPTYSKTGYFNTKIKKYPNGKSVTYYCNSSIFHKTSEESEELDKAIDDILDSLDNGDDSEMIKLLSQTETDHEKNIMRCVRRAKERIFDISFCNDWSVGSARTLRRSPGKGAALHPPGNLSPGPQLSPPRARERNKGVALHLPALPVSFRQGRSVRYPSRLRREHMLLPSLDFIPAPCTFKHYTANESKVGKHLA